MPINRGMDKEAVEHVHNGILLSHKKQHVWVNSSERDEPRVCYTEWSQREKNKHRMLKHMYGMQRNGTDEPICREGMEAQK